MQARSDLSRCQGRKIAFVPTMGFLHEGHLSLMKAGHKRADEVIVSIFVNPTQFGPGEDLEAYPRDFDRDCRLCEKEGVNAIFAPDVKELYPQGFQTYVTLEKLPNHLCGISRPSHFRGVATVVSKLFNIVKPHIAVFGEKDFQQLQVIRRMAKDMNSDIEIVGAPIVRETDGLAMSSRNTYLTTEQRISALSLYKSLKKAKEMAASGITDVKTIIDATIKLISNYPETAIDYVAVCDPEMLDDMKIIDRPAVMALAVKVGKTRLIDNMMLKAEVFSRSL
jgi:pantoate--beta-alanine ligase